MRYFCKAIPGRPLSTPRGISIQFEKIDDRTPGFLATENDYVIAELQAAIARQAGGISEATEIQYQDWVKKKLAQASQPQPSQERGLRLTFPPRQRSQGAVPVAAGADAPMVERPPRSEIKTEFPKVGRWREPTLT